MHILRTIYCKSTRFHCLLLQDHKATTGYSSLVLNCLRMLHALLRAIAVGQIASQSIMRSIPRGQLANGYFEELMRPRSTVQDDNGLSDLISAKFGNHVDPTYIVQAAYNETFYVSTGHFSLRVVGLHCNSRDDVCSVPERDITLTTRWWIPRHDNQVQVHQYIESQHRVPDLEARSGEPNSLATIAHKDQAKSQCQVEERSRVDLQVDDEVECVASRWCKDHDGGKNPLDEVRTEWCAEGAGRGPEARIR